MCAMPLSAQENPKDEGPLRREKSTACLRTGQGLPRLRQPLRTVPAARAFGAGRAYSPV